MRFERVIAQPISHPDGGVNLWLQFGDDGFWVDCTTRLVSDQFAVVFEDVMFAAETQCRMRGHELDPRVVVCWLHLTERPPGGIFYEPPAEAIARCRGVWRLGRLPRTSGFSRRWTVMERPKRRRASAPPQPRA